MAKLLSLGVNFFDTAEFYGFGAAETLLGQAFKDLDVKRSEIVVSTKIFWGGAREEATTVPAQFGHYAGKGVNTVGLSRKHIIEGTRASLKRL